MKKRATFIICLLLIFLTGCGASRDIPQAKSAETITDQSLSLLDQMIRSDEYASMTLGTDLTRFSEILEDLRAAPELTKPAKVYRLKINKEKLRSYVINEDYDLPGELLEYIEESLYDSIASIANAQKGADYMAIQAVMNAKAGGFCPSEKDATILLNTYDHGYPVLTVIQPLNDGYVEVLSRILFVGVSSEDDISEIKESLSSVLPCIKSVCKE